MNTLALSTLDIVNLFYLLAAVLFILGLKMLSNVKTAARGNVVSAVGMLIAAAATLFLVNQGALGENYLISFIWVGVAIAIGAVVGLVLATKVQMTGMPQMIALLNGFGGIASLLVAGAEYFSTVMLDPLERGMRRGMITIDPQSPELRAEVESHLARMAEEFPADFTAMAGVSWYSLLATGLAILIGGVTFTGSLVAFGKLQGLKITPGNPVQFIGQKPIIAILLALGVVLSLVLIAMPDAAWLVLIIAIASLVLGVLLVIGIGGADMPVVVALLNSYSGLAAAMAGFVLQNYALIITGSLVGASGLILTSIMCKAMNRSLMNVLFGGVGGAPSGGPSAAAGPQGKAREFTPEDAAIVLEAARQVVFVPGYGMAVAQAQHAVKELADLLEGRGIIVKFAIHPVAGRMPGHMNVLLAEAGVPYEQLFDLEQINPEFEQTDVALVIGANDVTNPAARHATDSPIYGMPILDVDKARTVFVIKRSLNPGFAGIENELYFRENCGMIFGDGKKVIAELVVQMDQI